MSDWHSRQILIFQVVFISRFRLIRDVTSRYGRNFCAGFQSRLPLHRGLFCDDGSLSRAQFESFRHLVEVTGFVDQQSAGFGRHEMFFGECFAKLALPVSCRLSPRGKGKEHADQQSEALDESFASSLESFHL